MVSGVWGALGVVLLDCCECCVVDCYRHAVGDTMSYNTVVCVLQLRVRYAGSYLLCVVLCRSIGSATTQNQMSSAVGREWSVENR